jgi:outer membrane receptor for ferrienterochelin and colicins
MTQSDIDLTAIPKVQPLYPQPKIFFYFNDNTTLTAGINATVENRIGGDLHYIEGNGDALHSVL